MIPLNIIARLRNQLPELRPAERKVADTILADLNWAISASIEEIASRAEVSQPTVTRFCRTIGSGNLKTFKLQVAQNLALSIPYRAEQLLPTDPPSEIVTKVCTSVASSVTELGQRLNGVVIDQAAAWFAAARRINCIGVGSGSGLVAHDASLRFNRLDLMANAYTDGHLQRLVAGLMTAEDVLFAISLEGKSPEILDSVSICQEKGAKVIALTTELSPLANKANLNIIIPMTSTDPTGPNISRIMQLIVIDMLSIAIGIKEEPQVLTTMVEAKKRLKYLSQNPLSSFDQAKG